MAEVTRVGSLGSSGRACTGWTCRRRAPPGSSPGSPTWCCTSTRSLTAGRAWVRSPWAAPRPFAAGGYVTFMAEFEPDRVRAACGAEKWRELVRITRRHDPGGVSHHNANIPPDADQAR